LQSSTNSTRYKTIANQVFIGCPWHRIRPKYERAIVKLKSRFPLYFVIIGRDDGQEAKDLLDHITRTLLSSSYAIFDATNGNPNVSLEYGVAEAFDIPRALYVSTHRASRASSKDSPIIADLAGKTRNHYTQERSLLKLMSEAARAHKYTERFERFIRQELRNAPRGLKRSGRILALKIIHCLDGGGTRRRTDIIQLIWIGALVIALALSMVH
jgi:hypothetical protein